MSFLRKEPGAVFASIFLIMGVTFVIAVALGEKASPVASQTFTGGLVDGGDWQATEFPAIEMN